MNPRSIGDYVIIKQIGQGSLGKVFLGEHRFLKRPFALKVLPEELASDQNFVQRFEKEMSMLGSIDHPHIVKIHNVSYADGQHFLVTDCILDSLGKTTNLAQYLEANDKHLSEDQILKIITQIAEAIDYAHQKKIGEEALSHRGLKLNNILIGNDKEGLRVYLSDFGLSRVIGQSLVLSQTYKALMDVVGLSNAKLAKLQLSFLQNYAFLAPEQKVSKAAREVDFKADIYAFGVLVYYLIMREFPDGFFELPSMRFPQFKLNWDWLISQCLQSDPQRRPNRLSEIIEGLKDSVLAEVVLKWKETKPSIKEDKHQEAPPEKKKSSSKAQSNSANELKPVLKPGELVRPAFDADPGAIFQIETMVARYQPQPPEHKNIEPLLTEMVVIPGGMFNRGSLNGGRDEVPRHAIRLLSFAVDIHAVTNEQFVRFLESMGGEKDVNNNDMIRLRDSRIKRSGGKLTIESGYAKHPVVGVAWYGAVAYAKWVGKRLPTEAEWEIAASGGREDFLYPTGLNIERSQANFFSSDTTAVMSYPPQDFGLYDMAGNVYEWCHDWYGFHYYDISIQEPDDPKGPQQGVYRVLRGGCWKSLKEDLRCAHRNRNNPGTMNGTYGFWCAADVS